MHSTGLEKVISPPLVVYHLLTVAELRQENTGALERRYHRHSLKAEIGSGLDTTDEPILLYAYFLQDCIHYVLLLSYFSGRHARDEHPWTALDV